MPENPQHPFKAAANSVGGFFGNIALNLAGSLGSKDANEILENRASDQIETNNQKNFGMSSAEWNKRATDSGSFAVKNRNDEIRKNARPGDILPGGIMIPAAPSPISSVHLDDPYSGGIVTTEADKARQTPAAPSPISSVHLDDPYSGGIVTTEADKARQTPAAPSPTSPTPAATSKPNNRPNSKPSNKAEPISFQQAVAEAKSAAQNRTSIADIERKTAKVAAMIGMNAPLGSGDSGESTSSTSNNSISNTSHSTTNVSSDYISGLRRDYEQMPTWRVNIG